MLEEDKVEGKFNDLEVEAQLYEDLYFGNLEKWDIKNSYDVGQIDQDTRNDLLHKFNISKKNGFSKAKEYIRIQVGYSEVTLFGDSSKKQAIAHKQYTDAVGELMNWMTNNSNASHTDIYNEGVRLVDGVNQVKDNKASIEGMKNKILNDTATVAGKNVTGHNLSDAKFKMYFKGAWNENEDWYNGYDHNEFTNTFLSNPSQITTLISELEEMRDLINKGGTYEVDKIKLWPGTTTTDIPLPKGVTATNVTDMITDLNVLKGFYDKQ
jgi:hypothetical protein